MCSQKNTMQSKEKNDKTICTKNKTESIIPIPAKVVADMVNGSASMVKKVREGKRTTGALCAKIQATDEMLAYGINSAFEKVNEIVNPKISNE